MKFNLYTIIFLITYSAAAPSLAKIKMYALCTPSHEILRDNYFLPSLQDDFDLIIENAEQTCTTSAFMSEGWTKTTIKKVDLIIKAIHENWGSFFIFSDLDIQFFQPIEDAICTLLKDNDLIIQKNCPSGVLCSGFFVCRANEKTLQLWSDVKTMMLQNPEQSDQITLNQCIKRHSKKNPYDVQWDYLPTTFFGGGTLTGTYWYPGKKLPVPQNIMIHHANWTRGIANKVAQLEYVKKIVKQQKL
jgi:hypothetical protein